MNKYLKLPDGWHVVDARGCTWACDQWHSRPVPDGIEQEIGVVGSLVFAGGANKMHPVTTYPFVDDTHFLVRSPLPALEAPEAVYPAITEVTT